MTLSKTDETSLATLELKSHVVRDKTTAVVKKYKTGFYLWGRGGVGKSFLVLNRLKELDVPYKLFNSRLTPKALFLALAENQDAIHVIEDCERLCHEPDAQGVLRSALFAQEGQDRVVTWGTVKDRKEPVIFRGGIIMINNRPMASLAELNALASRIAVLQFDATDEELIALMRKLALEGYRTEGKLPLEPEKCIEVTEYLLGECRAAACPLHMRLQAEAFKTYMQFASGDCTLDWRDLIAIDVRQAVHEIRHDVNPHSPKGKQLQRMEILREIMRQTNKPGEQLKSGEQLKFFMERTLASKSDFHRIKNQILGERERS
jgi:hypothetical protein